MQVYQLYQMKNIILFCLSYKKKKLYENTISDSTWVDVEFHPTGSAIAAASTDGSVKIFNLKTNNLLQDYNLSDKAITKAKFHPNGDFMLTASKDGTMKVCILCTE